MEQLTFVLLRDAREWVEREAGSSEFLECDPLLAIKAMGAAVRACIETRWGAKGLNLRAHSGPFFKNISPATAAHVRTFLEAAGLWASAA